MTGAAPGTGRSGLAGLPANLLVTGRRVVMVGAGRIAARKTESLLDLGARVEVVAPVAGDEIRAWADAGRLIWHARPFAPQDLDGAWLAFTATGDDGVNGDVFAAAEARTMWVNSADDPVRCSFTLMSVVRRADLVIAIGTGGRSPALVTHLRRVFNEEIGPEYETLLDLLSEARETMRSAGRSSEDADWPAAFRAGIVDLVKNGQIDAAKELLNSCL